MNPPFSAAVHVDRQMAEAALRHVASALARLPEGGRLVTITGANVAPDNPAWTESFIRLQEHGRIVFSAAIDGAVYAKHGTTIDTRLTVIDRVPADDVASFPASPGIAPDLPTLLGWVHAACAAASPDRWHPDGSSASNCQHLSASNGPRLRRPAFASGGRAGHRSRGDRSRLRASRLDAPRCQQDHRCAL